MYFVVGPNGFSGYGKTLVDALKDLKEQDDESHELKTLEFYKAQRINVELREVPTPVEVPKTAPTKTKK
jgi:hypothetical protein